ncbi:MAG: NfeD family protein [Pseudomonadota bacterium]
MPLLTILGILQNLGPYAWFIVGALFLTAEVILPGVNLIWFGAAASLVGIVLMAVPLGWEWQMALFLVSAGVSVVAARFIAARRPDDGEDRVNRGTDTMIGRELPLAEPIVNGTGRALYADGTWRVFGPDRPAGTLVRVVGVDASTLVVEPVEK